MSSCTHLVFIHLEGGIFLISYFIFYVCPSSWKGLNFVDVQLHYVYNFKDIVCLLCYLSLCLKFAELWIKNSKDFESLPQKNLNHFSNLYNLYSKPHQTSQYQKNH